MRKIKPIRLAAGLLAAQLALTTAVCAAPVQPAPERGGTVLFEDETGEPTVTTETKTHTGTCGWEHIKTITTRKWENGAWDQAVEDRCSKTGETLSYMTMTIDGIPGGGVFANHPNADDESRWTGWIDPVDLFLYW